MNGNDWTKRYPRIVEEAARLRAPLIIDAEVFSIVRAFLISTLCTVAQPMKKPWPWLSIFFCRGRIFAGSR